MKIQCPQCAVIGSVDESYSGKKVKCPKCDKTFVVGTGPGEPLASPLAPLPPHLPEMAAVSEAPQPAAELAEKAAEPAVNAAEMGAAPSTGVVPAPPLGDPAELSAAVSGEQPRAPEERIDWADIVSELDKENVEGGQRGREDMAPASLHEPLAPPVAGDGEGASDPVTARVEGHLAAAATVGVATALVAGDDQGQSTERTALDGVEQRPYGMDKEQCWQCGKKDSVGMPFIAKDGRLYCPDCLPAEVTEPPPARTEGAAATHQPRYSFTIGGLLREAWAKTKGVKGAIWAGSAIMYVAMIVIVAGGAYVLPQSGGDGWNPLTMVTDLLFQLLSNAVMVIFSAGIINIGIRKLSGEAVGWRMVFDGFPVAGKLVVAGILQSLLIMIGFLLLILPGIYLSVGYCMTLPLIVDRKMSPWQAMEASRKAVHEEWWKIFGLFLVMGLIVVLAALPLLLGLIWVWPMFVVCGALVYRSLFGIDKKVE